VESKRTLAMSSAVIALPAHCEEQKLYIFDASAIVNKVDVIAEMASAMRIVVLKSAMLEVPTLSNVLIPKIQLGWGGRSSMRLK
jgi:hypothetical protein